MKISWRIGILFGLAVLAGRSTAMGQAQSDAGTPDRAESPPATASTPARSSSTSARTSATTSRSPAAAAARRRSDPSFNRVVTNTRSAAARGSADPDPASAEAGIATDDPFRPYSPRARAAQTQSSIGSTRTTTPQAVAPQRRAPPHNYYPTMRGAQHVNADVPQARRHCTPSRGGVMGGSYARGR